MSRNRKRPSLLLMLVAAVLVSSCSASTVQTQSAPVSLSVSPSTVQVQPGSVIPFTATVTGIPDASVTWSVPGGAANGTITSNGVYTAPANIGRYAVAATVADGTKSSSATVIVGAPAPAPVAISVSPKAATITPGGSVTFTAIVTGSSNGAVKWSVEGGAANGTVASDGLYTAPHSAGSYTVVAISTADTSKSDTAKVTVLPSGGVGLAAQLATLSRRAIFFGHASVGENIIDGILTLEASNQGPEPSVTNQSGASPSTVASALGPGVLFGNGWGISNGDLVPKIAIFDRTMRGGVGAVAEIAMMKPCFSDFPGRSTPQQAFDAYVAAIDSLKALYPHVTFVHFTSPISAVNPDNVNSYRQAYSELIRAKYRGVEPLFDVAAQESTDPHGNQVLVDGIPAMYPGYTNDGGHLNGTGQEAIARSLVAYLASLP